jgi:hypothetical protein
MAERDNFDNEARTHLVVRTSPKGPGSPFIGKCALCGKEGLRADAALEPCDNPNGVTVGGSILAAIEGDGAGPVTVGSAPALPQAPWQPSDELPQPGSLQAAVNERNAWCDTAAQHCRNEDYYRSLLVQIGALLGPVAYTSNDGSMQQDVLCAKVPELVERLHDAAQFLFARLDDIDTASDMAKDNDKAYREHVERIQRRRFEVALTDGCTVQFILNAAPTTIKRGDS